MNQRQATGGSDDPRPGREHEVLTDGKVGVIEQGEYLVNLLVRDEPGARGLLPNLFEVSTHHGCTSGPALPHKHVSLHAHPDKAKLL